MQTIWRGWQLKCKMNLTEKRRHLEAILEVGAFILSKDAVVRTQDAGLLYMQYKELIVKKTSMEYYELFCKYMNIVQVYMYWVAYVMENVKGIGNAICALSNNIDEDVVIKKVVQERLQKKLFPHRWNTWILTEINKS